LNIFGDNLRHLIRVNGEVLAIMPSRQLAHEELVRDHSEPQKHCQVGYERFFSTLNLELDLYVRKYSTGAGLPKDQIGEDAGQHKRMRFERVSIGCSA
jgi:hypothetical protein